jgi:hypothetical protein
MECTFMTSDPQKEEESQREGAEGQRPVPTESSDARKMPVRFIPDCDTRDQYPFDCWVDDGGKITD